LVFGRLDSTPESDEEAAQEPSQEVVRKLGEALQEELAPAQEEAPRLCVGLPPLQSELGRWAQWAVRAEEWQSAVLGVPVKYVYRAGLGQTPQGPAAGARPLKAGLERQVSPLSQASTTPPSPAHLGLDGDLGDELVFGRLDSTPESDEEAAQEPSQEVVRKLGEALQEELAPAQEEAPRLCVGLPPLQSELGRWAQWAVRAEEWQSVVLGVPVKYAYRAGDESDSDDEASSEPDEQ